jgi:uncharacterized protein (DUF433 family)
MATHSRDFEIEEWLSLRINYAIMALREYVEVDPGKCAGVPVFRGTRFTLSQLLAELADNRSLSEIAENFDLNMRLLKEFLRGLSICLDRPLETREHVPRIKKVFEGVLHIESVEDGGQARVAMLNKTELSDHETMFVRVQSWDESCDHPDFKRFEDKKVRVTVEVIE